MKRICIDEAIAKVASGNDVIMSLAGWNFHLDFYPEIFTELVKVDLPEIVFIDAGGKEERLGFFLLPDGVSEDRISSYIRCQSARIFVHSPGLSFFEKIPAHVLRIICNSFNELTDEDLAEANVMEGFDWMILRDGDEGDDFYYLFEKMRPMVSVAQGSSEQLPRSGTIAHSRQDGHDAAELWRR